MQISEETLPLFKKLESKECGRKKTESEYQKFIIDILFTKKTNEGRYISTFT